MSEDRRSVRQFNRDDLKPADGADVKRLLRDFAEVLEPHEAEEPILHPSVRAALFEWMTEIRAAKELEAVGIKPRRNVLLYGPPGTGKTTVAHHLAARLGLPLALVRSESLIGKYLGETGKMLGALFDAMSKTEGRVVIFFDEIDALGGKRQQDSGASQERANSLNVMLRRIERFNGISMAATNRQDMLDTALWRRFHMQIEVALPGEDERFAILKRYAEPFDLPDDDLEILTLVTDGASPALLRGLMEGMKRSLVLGPLTKTEADGPVALFKPIIAGVAPPPEMEPPPLWLPDAVEVLGKMSWPIVRAA